MKYILILIGLVPYLLNAQIDTVKSGNVEVIDSTKNTKTIYPFKNSQVNGMVKAFDLANNQLIWEGKVENNQKQGTWNTFTYDSMGTQSVTQFSNFVNDTLEGPFTEQTDSMRTIGTYKKGKLNGAYKREFRQVDDSGMVYWTPIDSGQYNDSIKYGEWVFFYKGKLYKTGFYEVGKKHKHWFVYDIYDKGEKPVIMKETQYFAGVKTGNEKVHFHYDFETKADGSDDTVKVKEFEQIPWQNGELMGTYIKKDQYGNTIEKGTYNANKKVSTWAYYNPDIKTSETKTYLNDNLNGPYKKMVNEHLNLEGVYAMGKKNKSWKYYDDNGKIIREEVYDNGIKSGEWKYYNFKGYVGMSKIFEDDELIKITENNAVEVPILDLEFTKNDNSYEIIAEQLFDDSTEVKTYYYKPEGNLIAHKTFMELFKEKSKDTTVFILHGGYSVKKNGMLEYTGNYNMNLKDGTWDYFYNSSITWRKIYADGLMTKELFIDKITNKPMLKGDYILWYGPERPKIEFKIKEGIRHGKSLWYSNGGEVIKEEKYKEGVLQ